MKQLKYLLLVIPFLFIGSVKADDLTLTSQSDLDKFHEMFTDEEFSNNMNILINEYKEKYSDDYPYYVVNLFYSPYGLRNNAYTNFSFSLYYFDELPNLSFKGGGAGGSHYHAFISLESPSSGALHIVYRSTYQGIIDLSKKDTLTTSGLINGSETYILFNLNQNANPKYYEVNHFYYSNFDLTLTTFNNFSEDTFLDEYDNVLVPTLSDPTKYQVLSLSSDDLDYHFENLYDYDNNYNFDFSNSSHIEINLNNYAYIVLSLKDYNQEPFTTIQYVKGEYCVSGAYDYGLSSKEEYDSSVTDICTPYYDNFTPVKHYVLENDLKKHAIYYLKAHDTSKENKIRIDSSIFNIHYITEEEADNPVININGRNYSILPFDELPSNSIDNTENGFVPGASKEFSFADIFTSPLDFLKDIWGTIAEFFVLITSFISLLPPILQGFFYSSFTLSIVLGVIKILL